MRSMLPNEESVSTKSSQDPFRHTYMMLHVERGDNGRVLPLAQPVWCKRSANVSFMLLAKILNPKLARKAANTAWLEIMGLYPWLRELPDRYRGVLEQGMNMVS